MFVFKELEHLINGTKDLVLLLVKYAFDISAFNSSVIDLLCQSLDRSTYLESVTLGPSFILKPSAMIDQDGRPAGVP